MIDGIEGKWLLPGLDDKPKVVGVEQRVSEVELQLETLKEIVMKISINHEFEHFAQAIDDMPVLCNKGLQECL